MTTEIKTFKNPTELRDFWLASPYRFFAYLALAPDEKSWRPKSDNPYVISKHYEYLFSEDQDELYRTLLKWEKNGYQVYWYEAQQDDFDKYGDDLATGWWEIKAKREIPDWFRDCFFDHSEIPERETNKNIVERLARADLFKNDYAVGLYIYLISTMIQKSVTMPQFSYLFGLKHTPA